jgi:hypothetical protein
MSDELIQADNESAWDAELKPKERLFALYYCTNDECFLNASAAYRETYTKTDRKSGNVVIPEQSTCEVNGSKLLKKERVKNAVRKLLVISQEDLDTSNTYRLLKELELLATYNPADILNKAGQLKVKKLDDLGEMAKCITQITPTQYGVKYTLYDRNKALDKLVNYLNIVRPEQQTDVILPIMEIASKAINAESWNKQMEE